MKTISIEQGQQIAVVGRNGAGKTTLIDQFRKQMASGDIRYVTFRDAYGGDNDRTYFLQQRWNQMEMDEETSPLVLLSSGELRKYKLRQALEGSPRVLIIDNPFIGLDANSRDQLRDTLAQLSHKLQIILVLAKSDEIPEFITHVIEVSDMCAQPRITRQEYLQHRAPFPTRVLTEEKRQAILSLPTQLSSLLLPPSSLLQNPSSLLLPPSSEIISFRNVSIRYGERTILKDLSWTVRQGEHWALSGENGSGKSTLLSLVCADNPQAYACDIALFGRQRGSGESIWDIKRQIGYVSPEMHRAYKHNIPALRIVASGLKDTMGLYVRATEQELEQCRWWMRIFGIYHLADRPFMQMSSGEQRLVLVCRAFVKDPQLLILDEPLHGLDNVNRRLVKDVIEAFCERPDKTLIFVTHYKEELPAVIDHSLYLNKN